MNSEVVVGSDEVPPSVNTVRVLENGPLAIHATLTMKGEIAGYRATLCRCGRSGNKPYCDGSHDATGFSASGEPSPKEPMPTEIRGGVVNVRPRPNGPLKVTGPVELISDSGRTFDRGHDFALCRCGQSKDKPYCDGSHKSAGFLAD